MRTFFLAIALVALARIQPAQDNLLDKQHRDEARRHYEDGEARMLAESFEDAAREFRAAIRLDPTFALAHYSLGQALMALKRYPDALAAYTACRDTFTNASGVDQRNRAEIDTQRRDEMRELEDSLDRLRTGKIKGATPGQDVALEQRIHLLKESEMRGAEQTIRVPAEVSLALGSAYFRLNRLQEAESSYREAIAADARLGAAHNNLAVIYMMSGRLQEAEQQMKLAERSGFTVSPQFKDDLKAKLKAEKK